mmetsp:Transcript_86258/g.244485  ORF Transcript_86258/g.244485 Transcript_86258/m.244485 type:complete len:202 (+) Transcript_86258:1121-1726(+)
MPEHCASSRRRTASFLTSNTSTTWLLAPPPSLWQGGEEKPAALAGGELGADGGGVAAAVEAELEVGGPRSTARQRRSGANFTAMGRRAASRAQGGAGWSSESRTACSGKVPPALMTTTPASSADASRLKPLAASGSMSASGISAYMLLGATGTVRRGGSMRDHGGSAAIPPLPALASTHDIAATGLACRRRVLSTAPDSPS